MTTIVHQTKNGIERKRLYGSSGQIKQLLLMTQADIGYKFGLLFIVLSPMQ